MAFHGPSYGMSAEVAKTIASKHDPVMERQAKQWVEAVTGRSIAPSFHEGLKDGSVLCELATKITGTRINVGKGKMPFIMMENIGKFLEAIEAYGVKKTDTFMTVDLYEAKNLGQVVLGIHAFAKLPKIEVGMVLPFNKVLKV
eukprot:TRINITY_DN1950_c0_g1_i4.p1 TRINITY_DN1950_c0_g1~~TRINITY_DN1950_c0_g1_i4.p1  ORF type:complete len:143 (+),score=36.71 TRINITY_DN1950_c0_g1_i4:49-477(+)